MAMNRNDIARAMFVGQNKYFFEIMNAPRREEYKLISTPENSTKKAETYDTIGNLQAAQVKNEEAEIQYGKVTEAYQTTLTNKTVANGFFVSMEAEEDDQYGIVDKVRTKELARTMQVLREKEVAAVYNNYLTTVGADGKTMCADDHPLLGTAGVNDNKSTLTTPSPDNFIAVANMFNSIKNHAGDPMDTEATAGLFHRNYTALVTAILQSSNKALEQSNTKNTVPSLRAIFNRYINQLPWFFLDEQIESVVFQRRKALTTNYHLDKQKTLNMYYNAVERYVAGFINPGFGIVGVVGA